MRHRQTERERYGRRGRKETENQGEREENIIERKRKGVKL